MACFMSKQVINKTIALVLLTDLVYELFGTVGVAVDTTYTAMPIHAKL